MMSIVSETEQDSDVGKLDEGSRFLIEPNTDPVVARVDEVVIS